MAQQPVRALAEEQEHPSSESDTREREHRLHVEGHSSVTHSIADAVVIKGGELFFLCDVDGDVPAGGAHGLGLYYHDCRFLDEYRLRLGEVKLESLVSTAESGFQAIIQLTNPDMRTRDGALIRKQAIGIKWKRTIEQAEVALRDQLTIQNFGTSAVTLPVSLSFASQFEPLFVVRGMLTEKRGTSREPSWSDDSLSFRYDGADGLERRLDIQFSGHPTAVEGTTALFEIHVKPGEKQELLVSLFVSEDGDPTSDRSRSRAAPDLKRIEAAARSQFDSALAEEASIRSDSLLLNGLMDRSLRDLQMLETRIGDSTFFAAGVPWFVTLFGRDTLIAALQMLPFDPDIAAQTLRLLARYQGQHVDEWRDEEPGKIMHELRVGELAHIDAVPQTPYYGTIDATPLFLIVLGRHAAWTGDLVLFEELHEHVERALDWMANYGDRNRDGYLEYSSASKKGLANQGWKDSGDAIMNQDGSLARPPISLVEVQGYCYEAKCLIADLFERAGDRDRGTRLRREAGALRDRFNDDFWIEDQRYYALALQGDGSPAAVISSNPGQALWTGIVDPARAPAVISRLMAEDMFSGWGIRTLSSRERRYNPVGYHVGTVWPHDNALIAAGFRRYGADEEACRVFTGLVEAARHFEHDRLPEAFAGFARSEYAVPVRYPVACHPQAWASGAIPFALHALLGLTPEAFEQRLRIVRPVLPAFVDRLAVERLRVGRARVDLVFQRGVNGVIETEVTSLEGRLDVHTER